MANADRPAGLVPVEYLNGAPWTGKCHMYVIPDSDDTNAYAIGDPVVLAGSADSKGVATITLATAGATNSILGAFMGMVGLNYGESGADPAANGTIVVPAVKSKSYYVLVADDPNTIFEIQEDGVGGTIAAASVGLNADLVAGTNNGYVSAWELDSSSVANGATLQVKVLGAVQRVDNALGANCKWRVLINLHCYRIGQVGY